LALDLTKWGFSWDQPYFCKQYLFRHFFVEITTKTRRH